MTWVAQHSQFLHSQTWNLPLNFGFCSFQIHAYNKKENGCQSQSPPITTFFPQTYLQENATQPRVNQPLGPSHANPFPENKSKCFAMTWGPPVIKFIHMCMGKSIRKSVWLIFFDGKND